MTQFQPGDHVHFGPHGAGSGTVKAVLDNGLDLAALRQVADDADPDALILRPAIVLALLDRLDAAKAAESRHQAQVELLQLTIAADARAADEAEDRIILAEHENANLHAALTKLEAEYQDGVEDAWHEGFYAALTKLEAEYQAGVEDAWHEGFYDGHAEGFGEGYDEGYSTAVRRGNDA